MKSVIILSGGMDSTTLLYDIIKKGEEVYAISFNYNQRHKKELKMAKKTCRKLNVNHKIINLKILGEIAPSCLTRDTDVPEGNYNDENMKQTVVPNRNMVMLSLAISYAIGIGAKKVYYGAHSGDHAIYPDCRKEFIEAMQKVSKLCDWNEIELDAPYIDMDKGDIAIRGKELGVDYSQTWTCYKGLDEPCLKCGSCKEREEALRKVSLVNETENINTKGGSIIRR